MNSERTELVRYWLEFDITGQGPDQSEGVVLDGGSSAFRYLARGVGVTGYSEADCLELLHQQLGIELPNLVRASQDVDLRTLHIDAAQLGVPAWRGIWYPALNRSGPTE